MNCGVWVFIWLNTHILCTSSTLSSFIGLCTFAVFCLHTKVNALTFIYANKYTQRANGELPTSDSSLSQNDARCRAPRRPCEDGGWAASAQRKTDRFVKLQPNRSTESASTRIQPRPGPQSGATAGSRCLHCPHRQEGKQACPTREREREKSGKGWECVSDRLQWFTDSLFIGHAWCLGVWMSQDVRVLRLLQSSVGVSQCCCVDVWMLVCLAIPGLSFHPYLMNLIRSQ